MKINSRYPVRTLCQFGTLCLGIGIAILLNQHNSPSQVQPDQIAKRCQNVKVSTVAEMKWGNPIHLKVSEFERRKPYPEGGIDYSLWPGPKKFPVRTILIPSAGPNGIAAKLENGPGLDQAPMVVTFNTTPQVISLKTAPYRVIARNDGGVWSLSEGKVTQYSSAGEIKTSLDFPGEMLMGAGNNSVWVVNATRAWFIKEDGQLRGKWQWSGWGGSRVIGNNLCKWERKAARVECLTPEGKIRFISPNWLKKQPVAGNIIKITRDSMLTIGEGNSLRYYNSQGATELAVTNVGLTSSGTAFAAIKVDENWTDVCLANGSSRRIPVTYKNSSFKFPLSGYRPTMQIIAVDQDRTLAYNLERAIWYKNGQMEKSFTVNDAIYRQDIFPHVWISGSFHIEPPTVNQEGAMIISSSGPIGIALVKVEWEP